MKITLFTSNDKRHNFFINMLSEVSEELFVVQECKTIFPGIIPGSYPVTETMKKYFSEVKNAQLKLFGNSLINTSSKKIKILPMLYGDLNKCSISFLSDFLKSDIYIVLGSSYIKGELIEFLLKKKALNIHAGVVPYYRGNDCNFWALFDDNPHLVGSTIHLLSKGLDSGDILYHAMSKVKSNPFEYTMSTLKSAFYSIFDKIKSNTLFDLKPQKQEKAKQIRYTKRIDFDEAIVKEYFKKRIDLESKKFNNSLLIEPYYLEKL